MVLFNNIIVTDHSSLKGLTQVNLLLMLYLKKFLIVW